jgi:hypothetical protein
MFATYKITIVITLNLNTMETNVIIIALVLVFAIALIVFLIVRNQKDKEDLISSINAQEDSKEVSEGEKDID